MKEEYLRSLGVWIRDETLQLPHRIQSFKLDVLKNQLPQHGMPVDVNTDQFYKSVFSYHLRDYNL